MSPYQRLIAFLNPDRYHGHAIQKSFFEGWYFKIASADRKAAMAIIPGTFMSKAGDNRFAFVMVLDSQGEKVHFARYPIDAFSASNRQFDITIGANRFTKEHIQLDLSGEGIPVKGKIQLHDLVSWPVTLRSPGIMGWYGYVPFMECFHGVVSMDHSLDGTLDIEGRKVILNGGRGYTEKDWGRAFPSSWIWTQCNHFETPGISLSLSCAVIPFLGRSFGGLIAGLWLDNKLYRFATYTGARVKSLTVNDATLDIVIADRKFELSVAVERGPVVTLWAPTDEDMVPRVEETLKANLSFCLTEQASGKIIHTDNSGAIAGLEVQGNMEELTYLALHRGNWI